MIYMREYEYKYGSVCYLRSVHVQCITFHTVVRHTSQSTQNVFTYTFLLPLHSHIDHDDDSSNICNHEYILTNTA